MSDTTENSQQQKQEVLLVGENDDGTIETVNGIELSPEEIGLIKQMDEDPNAVFKSELNGQMYEQLVLPETVERIISETPDGRISDEMRQEVMKINFTAMEIRNHPNLPDINVFLPADIISHKQFTEENIVNRLINVISMLGIPADQISAGAIIIDPTKTGYKDARAFYHISANRLWIKLDNLLAIDHEATHWATYPKEGRDGLHNKVLLQEGIATWTAWQVKTEAERNSVNATENFSRGTKIFGAAFNEDEVRLDMSIHNLPAMSLGAELCEVLVEQIGGAHQLMEHWQNVDNYHSVSDWVTSMGLDAQQVETAWKKRIFS